MNIKDNVFYVRVLNERIEICDLIIRTIENDYFVGIDKRDKHAYLFSYSDIGNIVFYNRKEALDFAVMKEDAYSE